MSVGRKTFAEAQRGFAARELVSKREPPNRPHIFCAGYLGGRPKVFIEGHLLAPQGEPYLEGKELFRFSKERGASHGC
jgi:hypothetical protein